MSDTLTLAAALEAHAAAVTRLAEVIAAQGATAPSSPRSEAAAGDPQPRPRGRPRKEPEAPAAGTENDAAPEATNPGSDPASTPESAAPTSDTGPSATTDASPSEPDAEEVTYDAVKALILKVSGAKGRDAAAAVLTELGVAKGPDLKPEQYAEAVDKLQAVLADEDLA